MFAAVLTSFFFALSAIFGQRSTLHLGSQRANLARQIVALLLLGLWAHTWGGGLNGVSFGVLFLSGVIGFGLGDWALFESYPRLGSALAVLICQCLAAPIAALTEWIWMGTSMSLIQMTASVIVLLGVVLAMAPAKDSEIPKGHRLAGIIYGVVAATGQAWGAVLSRYAFQQAHEAGFSLDGITAAYQRLWGGGVTIVVLLLIRQVVWHWRPSEVASIRPDWRLGWPWILANALAGATIGVSCYQWALKSAPSAVVLPIVATTPLLVLAIAFIFEGIRPIRRTIVGAIVAVAGVVTLVLSRPS
jgi:drug/metabolite transporter (DMT)-like permease